MDRNLGTNNSEQQPTVFFSMRYSAANSSALPPISPIIIIPSQSGSVRNTSKQSMKSVPLNGSPPMPTHNVCPSPAFTNKILLYIYLTFYEHIFKICLQVSFDLQPHKLEFLISRQYQSFLFDVYDQA